VLRAGGDAGLLGVMFEATIVVSGLFGEPVWSRFDRATHDLPTWAKLLVFGAVLGGVAFVARRASDEHRQDAVTPPGR
jgi:hypothetical protein